MFKIGNFTKLLAIVTLFPLGKPPALPGDSKSLTVTELIAKKCGVFLEDYLRSVVIESKHACPRNSP